MYENLIENFLRTSVANHNHTLTATSFCHHFGIEDPKEVRKVQEILYGLRDDGRLRVLDYDQRYTPETNRRKGNLYLILEAA